MATIHDYLYWRGDIPLTAMPLNELDGLVLTRFAYLPMEEFPFDEEETIGSLCEKLKALPEEHFKLAGDLQFYHQLCDAKRFSDLPVSHYIKDNNEDIVLQFAAVTIHLSDTELYISYCGTDSTLLGWKEDFYMSFMEDVPAQKAALAYAKWMAEEYSGTSLYLGGHSKGGNLAIYTAVNLPAELKERLVHVSNYDGPGFPKDYIESHDFQDVLDRLHTFIPQESMIGRIHEHVEGFSVVESTERGLNQHNIYSWQVEPTCMVPVEEPDEASEIMYRAIQNVLQSTTPDARKAYIDRMYDMLTAADVTTMKEVTDNLPKRMNAYLHTLGDMPEEERKESQEMNSAMLKAYLDAFRDFHGARLENTPIGEFLSKTPFSNLFAEDSDRPEETLLNEDA